MKTKETDIYVNIIDNRTACFAEGTCSNEIDFDTIHSHFIERFYLPFNFTTWFDHVANIYRFSCDLTKASDL